MYTGTYMGHAAALLVDALSRKVADSIPNELIGFSN
jgi:hypothetical protein